MIFQTLHLSGFGIFAGAELADLAPGLNIIEGRNEAGKSTCLEFIRALLFGYQTGKGARSFTPLRGGAAGGWSLIRDNSGRQFRWELAVGPPAVGRRLVRAVGAAESVEPGELLGGADRKLFAGVFAFSMEEMNSLQNLREGGLQERIFAAASGTGGSSLLSAIGSVDKQLLALYNASGSIPLANRLLRERGELQKALAQLPAAPAAYTEAIEEQAKLQTEITEATDYAGKVQAELARAKICAEVWKQWIALRGAREQLGDLPDVSCPEDALPRLEASLQKREGVRKQIAEQKAGLAAIRKRREELKVDEALLDLRSAIDAVKERLTEYQGAARDLPLVSTERDRSHSDGIASIRKLGAEWTEERLAEIDLSLAREEQIRVHRNRRLAVVVDLRTAGDRVASLESDCILKRRLAEQAGQKADELFPEVPPTVPNAQQRVDSLEQALEFLGEAALDGERTTGAEQRLQALTESEAEVRSGTIAGRGSALLLAALATLALGLLVAAAVMPGSPANRLALGGAGLILGIAALFAWRTDGSARGKAAASGSAKAGRLRLEITEQEKRLAGFLEAARLGSQSANRLLEPLGLAGQPAEAVRAEMRRTRLAVEERRGFEAASKTVMDRREELEALKESLGDAQRKAETAREERDRVEQLWKQWVVDARLPSGIEPEGTLRLLGEAQTARDRFADRNGRQRRIEAMQTVIDDFTAAVGDLHARLLRPDPSDGALVDSVRRLAEEARLAAEAQAKRLELDDRIENVETELTGLSEHFECLEGELNQRMEAVGAAQEEDYRERIRLSERVRKLRREIEELERLLENRSGPGDSRLELEADLASLDALSLDERLRAAEDKDGEAVTKLQKLREQLGRVGERIRQLEQQEPPTARLREMEDKTADLETAVERWAVHRLTKRLLEQTRERFERERQPAVIRRAGELMGEFTGGRYATLIAPRGLEQVELEERNGARKGVEAWSRGTREQLYLALRLAFVEDYSRHAEPLPIVMDDVLVDADTYERLQWVAATIASVSQSGQILYFTCHPRHADLLAMACPNAHRYRVEDGQFSLVTPVTT